MSARIGEAPRPLARGRGRAGKSAWEAPMRAAFFIMAISSVLAVVMICAFLLFQGLDAIFEIGLIDFLFGEQWKPSRALYGILPMILGSVYVTAGALVVGVPIGVLTAVYLVFYCPDALARRLQGVVGLMAGIPSVVYGFFGLTVLAPIIGELTDTGGMSILTASLLLGLMILPTIIGVAQPALAAVPKALYEGSLALGASHERSVFRVMLPAARSGVLASVALGLGRAVGETMAVIMVAGNQARMPKGILNGVRTLTVNIAMEMGYAADLHRGALIGTGVALLVFILLINACFASLKGKGGE